MISFTVRDRYNKTEYIYTVPEGQEWYKFALSTDGFEIFSTSVSEIRYISFYGDIVTILESGKWVKETDIIIEGAIYDV